MAKLPQLCTFRIRQNVNNGNCILTSRFIYISPNIYCVSLVSGTDYMYWGCRNEYNASFGLKKLIVLCGRQACKLIIGR